VAFLSGASSFELGFLIMSLLKTGRVPSINMFPGHYSGITVFKKEFHSQKTLLQ
jgi:hypothetical protein